MLGGFHGLDDAHLNEGRDLPVSLDWRDVLASTLRESFALDEMALDRVFLDRPGQSLES